MQHPKRREPSEKLLIVNVRIYSWKIARHMDYDRNEIEQHETSMLETIVAVHVRGKRHMFESQRECAPPPPSVPWFSADLKETLEALTTIDVVSVAFETGETVCQDDGSEVASVTFVTQHGDVPLLIADASLLVDDSNGGVSRCYGDPMFI